MFRVRMFREWLFRVGGERFFGLWRRWVFGVVRGVLEFLWVRGWRWGCLLRFGVKVVVSVVGRELVVFGVKEVVFREVRL